MSLKECRDTASSVYSLSLTNAATKLGRSSSSRLTSAHSQIHSHSSRVVNARSITWTHMRVTCCGYNIIIPGHEFIILLLVVFQTLITLLLCTGHSPFGCNDPPLRRCHTKEQKAHMSSRKVTCVVHDPSVPE